MNRAVFCTFDHRDIADLSIGKLKAAVPGVKSVSYVDEGFAGIHGGYQNNVITGDISDYRSASWLSGSYPDNSIRPARPVTLKIICDEHSQQKVVSKLINLHAYRIVAT
jgi:hypothetical protein